MINGYPGASPRRLGGEAVPPDRPSGSGGSPYPDLPAPMLGFVGPPPVLPAVGAGTSAGAGLAILEGAALGGTRGPFNPYWIAGGAIAGGILGYVAYQVATWSYDINLMWSAGFSYCKRNLAHDVGACRGAPLYAKGPIKWWGSLTAVTAPCTDFTNCNIGAAPPGFNKLGQGIVTGSHTQLNLYREVTQLSTGARFYGLAEQWHRGATVNMPAPAAIYHIIEVPLYDPWNADALPILRPGFGTPALPYPLSHPTPGTQPPGPNHSQPTWPDVVEVPLTTSPIVVMPDVVPLPGQPGVVVVPVTHPPIIVDPTPGTGPGTQPGTGPGTGPGTSPGPGTDPGGSPNPDPSTDPGTAPGTGTGGGTGGGTSPGTRNPSKKNEKERKIHVKSVVPAGMHLGLNIVTEGLDFIGVLYDSIPKACRKKAGVTSFRPSVAEKMKAIYHCYSQIPLAEAFANYLNNQFEDYVYGQLGRLTGRATGRFNITTGLNRALREAQGGISDAAGGGVTLPEITYDEATGEFGLKWLGYEVKSGDIDTKNPL